MTDRTAATPQPRTLSGRAWISAVKPHIRRGVAPTIVAIEREAAEPYATALGEADAVLAELMGSTAVEAGLRTRAAETRERIARLLRVPTGPD